MLLPLGLLTSENREPDIWANRSNFHTTATSNFRLRAAAISRSRRALRPEQGGKPADGLSNNIT
jgi:hypothetical protein